MARAKWSKAYLRWLGPIGGIFVAMGMIFGLLGGGGIVVGALVGVLMFVIFVGAVVLYALFG